MSAHALWTRRVVLQFGWVRLEAHQKSGTLTLELKRFGASSLPIQVEYGVYVDWLGKLYHKPRVDFVFRAPIIIVPLIKAEDAVECKSRIFASQRGRRCDDAAKEKVGTSTPSAGFKRHHAKTTLEQVFQRALDQSELGERQTLELHVDDGFAPL